MLTLCSFSRHSLEVEAVCGSSARTDHSHNEESVLESDLPNHRSHCERSEHHADVERAVEAAHGKPPGMGVHHFRNKRADCHANATKVEIVLRETPEEVELRISDDGKGITEKQISNPKSFGLMGIKERLLSLGGYVTSSLAEKLAAYLYPDRERPVHEFLSDREYQVVLMIASGKTVSEIANALSLSVKTISTNRSRALAKMGMKTNAELTHYAISNGLVA